MCQKYEVAAVPGELADGQGTTGSAVVFWVHCVQQFSSYKPQLIENMYVIPPTVDQLFP